jgi:hypothetical protein
VIFASITALETILIPAVATVIVALIGLAGLFIKRKDDRRFATVVGDRPLQAENGNTKTLIDTVQGLTLSMATVQREHQECESNLKIANTQIDEQNVRIAQLEREQ